MGIAVLSGVVESLDNTPKLGAEVEVAKWESHTPGTLTPNGPPDETSPSRYIACVNRQESATKLRKIFGALGPLGSSIEVVAGRTLSRLNRPTVVLLWQLLISILAGVTMRQLSDWVLPSTKVIRAMPNTPCKIREGMTVVSTLPPSPDAEKDHARILKIFSSIGRCRFLEEKHFDACTALSGSGPAFACIFMEAMADGGVMMGLPRAEALELAAQTLQGAARMVLQGGTHPAQLKDAVTTPGGCTIAGLLAMEDGRVRSTIARAIQVATEHASQLGQPKK
ncbi:pyrroline-5-carboxylate reductase [Lyophyllum atratum]|nr:pyrroline-5-carboxylate reductase [Lyophyllum atratum]